MNGWPCNIVIRQAVFKLEPEPHKASSLNDTPQFVKSIEKFNASIETCSLCIKSLATDASLSEDFGQIFDCVLEVRTRNQNP